MPTDLAHRILWLERQVAQLGIQISLAEGFKGPNPAQQLVGLGEILGGGWPGHSPYQYGPTGFGCDGGMPNTLNWSDPVFGNTTMTFDSGSGCYSTPVTLVNTLVPCDGGCTGAGVNNVPMQITYCPSGVTTCYKGDGSNCPLSGTTLDALNDCFTWPAPTILVCDTVTPANTTSNPTSPSDGSGPGTKSNNLGYCSPNNVASFGPFKSDGTCPYAPRTIYLKDTMFGLWTCIYNDTNHQWESLHKTVTIPANVNGHGCAASTQSCQMFYAPSTGVPAFSVREVGGCANSSGGFFNVNAQTYTRDSCNPYRAHGAWTDATSTIITSGTTYTLS